MPLIRIGRERESLTFSGEAFKKAVRLYLESLGYSETTDSYVEGHFQDMVFVNSVVDPGRLFFIEAKATKVGLGQNVFCSELMKYLYSWLNTPKEKRFKFLLFVQEASNLRWWKAIFGDDSVDIDENTLKGWINDNKIHLSDEKYIKFEKYQWNEILSFFKETNVHIGPAYRLEIAAEEKRKTSALSPDRKAENLLEESERRNQLIEKKCLLVSNFVRLKLPEFITIIETEYKKPDEIWNKFQPPFKLEGKFLYTFCPHEESIFDKLNSVEYETIETNDLLSSNPQKLISLINYHINGILRYRGMKKYKNTYFFEPNFHGYSIKDKYVENLRGKKRQVTHPVFQKIENAHQNVNSKPYYVFHRAVKISAKMMWDQCYIQINPVRHFTTDGRTPIEGENKDRIDRKYRNPLYNRNSTFLSWIKFWKYCLLDAKIEDKYINYWFRNFKFGDFEEIEVIGIPESIEKEQRTLLDWEL